MTIYVQDDIADFTGNLIRLKSVKTSVRLIDNGDLDIHDKIKQ